MEDSKKKPIMIGVIVVCLVVAGLITFARRGGGGSGLDAIPEGKMTWVKCNNPSCNAEYQMSEREFFKLQQERLNPMARTAPPLTCEKCGKDSLYRALKCPYCGTVFFRDSVPNDLFDRCPKCKKSETEETRKRRLSGQE
jgi:phage FluMu protein Com